MSAAIAAFLPAADRPRAEDAAWHLPRGASITLAIGPGERRLRVTRGRLWLTGEGRPGRPAADVWLAAGDGVRLASGSTVVAEGWPQASFELIVPPAACASPTARVGGWLARRLGR